MVVTEGAPAGDQGTTRVDGVEQVVSSSVAAAAPSFAAVYREHATFVYASLLRLGVPRSSVDDALQDVFVVVHRRLPGFEGRSSMRSWLFGIVRRIAFRQRRGAQRADAKARSFGDEPRIDPSASDVFDHHQRVGLLERALDHLDDDKRVAITLHVFEEMTGPELAASLGVPVDTAYSRIKAARRELQRALAELGADANEAQLVTQMREATLPDRPTRKRAAALVAARLGVDAASLGGAAAFVGFKGVLAAVLLGASATVAIAAAPAGQDPPSAAQTSRAVDRLPSSGDATPAAEVAQLPAELGPVATTPSVAMPEIAPLAARTKATTNASPTAPAAVAPITAEALRAEVALVTRAKRALDDGDPEAALGHLAAHGREFPDGQLTVERAGYRCAALCALGRVAQGRGEGRLFLDQHGSSSVAARVAAACEISR